MDWEHRADYIRHRSIRKGNPREFDVGPEWATEAALEPRRLVRDSGSEKGVSIEVIGYSPSAGRTLTVMLVPKSYLAHGGLVGGRCVGSQRCRRPRLPSERIEDQ